MCKVEVLGLKLTQLKLYYYRDRISLRTAAVALNSLLQRWVRKKVGLPHYLSQPSHNLHHKQANNHKAGLSCPGPPGRFWQISEPYLNQGRGAVYAHQIATGNPGFSDLPTALQRIGAVHRWRHKFLFTITQVLTIFAHLQSLLKFWPLSPNEIQRRHL